MPTLRSFVAGAAVIVSLLGIAQGAAAQTPEETWTCRASAGYLAGEPGRLEPVLANGQSSGDQLDRPTCADDSAGAPAIQQGGLKLSTPSAATNIDPDGVEATRVQLPSASASIANAEVANGSGFTLSATKASSSVSAQCDTDNQPQFSGTSTVSEVKVNGQSVPTEGILTQVGNGLNGSPVGGLIRVTFNEEEKVGDAGTADQALIRRAVHVRITNATGATVFEAVLAESKVDRHGAVCAPAPPPEGCPPGSRLENGVCVLEVIVERPGNGGGGGQCPAGSTRNGSGNCVAAVTIVDRGPGGGFITTMQELKGTSLAKGPCRKRGLGLKVVILGSHRADRITGTNVSDRVIALAGSDRISGGRGNDCVEGGSGNDRLEGSNGADHLFGDSGRDILSGAEGTDRLYGRGGVDKLSGGSGNDLLSGGASRDKLSGGLGNDRLHGHSGNDLINTGNGRDRVLGGAGHDAINSATAGPPAQLSCGSGRDKVRVNFNERRRVRGCETVFVITRARR